MDLNKLDVVKAAGEGAILELLHPGTGEVLTDDKGKKPKAFYLKLLGNDSDVFRKSIKRRLEKRLGNKKNNDKIDLDVEERKGVELLAKCTVECFMIEDGKEIDCTNSEMVRLYLKYPWLREQAEEFMADRENLMMS